MTRFGKVVTLKGFKPFTSAAMALDAWYDKPVRTLLARRFSQAKPAAMPAP